MSFKRCLIVLPMLAMLSGCGGGGGDSAVTINNPAPAPTPTPVVTSPTYAEVFNFNNGFIDNSIMAETTYRMVFNADNSLSYDTSSPATATINPSMRAAQVNLQASPLTIGVIAGTDHYAFSSGDILSSANDQLSASITANNNGSSVGQFFTLFHPFQATISQSRYVGFSFLLLTQGANITTRTPFIESKKYFLFGSETVSDDFPKSGTSSYHVQITSSTATYDDAGTLSGEGQLTLDFASNQLRGSFPVVSTKGNDGISKISATLSFSGTLDVANNRITGDVTSSDSSFRGSLNGSLFGPRAQELGFLIAIRSDAGGVVGAVAGPKQ